MRREKWGLFHIHVCRQHFQQMQKVLPPKATQWYKTPEIKVNIQVCCLFLFFAALFYRRVKMVVKGDHPLSLLMC